MKDIWSLIASIIFARFIALNEQILNVLFCDRCLWQYPRIGIITERSIIMQLLKSKLIAIPDNRCSRLTIISLFWQLLDFMKVSTDLRRIICTSACLALFALLHPYSATASIPPSLKINIVYNHNLRSLYYQISNREILLWDLNKNDEYARVHIADVFDKKTIGEEDFICFSPTIKPNIFTFLGDRKLITYDIAKHSVLSITAYPGGCIVDVYVGENSNTLAYHIVERTGGDILLTLDTLTKKEIGKWPCISREELFDKMRSVLVFQAYHPRNIYAATSPQSGVIIVRDIKSQKELWSDRLTGSDLLLFSPDGKHLLVKDRFPKPKENEALGVQWSSTPEIRSVADGKVEAKIAEHKYGIINFGGFSSDGKYVLFQTPSHKDNKAIKAILWDWGNNQVIQSYSLPPNVVDTDYCALLSPDGKHVIIATKNLDAIQYDTFSGVITSIKKVIKISPSGRNQIELLTPSHIECGLFSAKKNRP
jgi:hypothetical protein